MVHESLKVLGGVLLGSYALVYAEPLLVSYALSIKDLFVPRIRVRTEALNACTGLPPEYTALDYLSLASSLVHNDSTDKGRCWDYASATYSTYNWLVRRNRRKDLERCVRMNYAHHTVEDGKKTLVGHTFLEARQTRGGSFTHYNPGSETPPLDPHNPEQVKAYTHSSLPRKSEDTWKSSGYAITRTVPGTLIHYPTPRNFTVFPLGAAQLFAEAVRDRKSLSEDAREWDEWHEHRAKIQ